MTSKQRSTLVGIFESHDDAVRAIDDLRAAGFDQIGIAAKQEDGSATTTGSTDAEETASDSGSGALTGALAGAGLGALAGLGILAGVIPVIGPAIAGGTLGILLSNAAAGAGLAGLTGALVGAGLSEDEATYYQDEFQSGRTIVTVNAGARLDEAETILRRHGAYDMETRGAMSSGGSAVAPRATSGTTGTLQGGMSASEYGTGATHAETSTGHAAMGTEGMASGLGTGHTSRTASGGETVEVREERLHANKSTVEAGEVRVGKEIITEHQTLEVPVEREEIVIERHAPTGHTSASSLTDLTPGEEIRIPVKEEQVHVSKEAVVTEEVSVGKRKVQDTEHVSGTVRKEQVRIETEGDVDVRNKGTGHV